MRLITWPIGQDDLRVVEVGWGSSDTNRSIASSLAWPATWTYRSWCSASVVGHGGAASRALKKPCSSWFTAGEIDGMTRESEKALAASRRAGRIAAVVDGGRSLWALAGAHRGGQARPTSEIARTSAALNRLNRAAQPSAPMSASWPQTGTRSGPLLVAQVA